MIDVRTFADGVFTSTGPTTLRMRVSPDFAYLGSFLFDLGAVARVERHVFADIAARAVRRLLVLHFEEFLPGVDDHYRYALHDQRVLGGDAYGRSSGVLSVREEREGAPQAEMAQTAVFLASRGLALPDRHAVARYARIIGEERRRELLIFYHETEGTEDDILERAERAFDVTMDG